METRVRAQRRSEPRTEGVLLAAGASAGLFALPVFVPAAVPLVVVCPLPLALQRLRSSAASAGGSALAAAALLAAVLGPGRALFFALVLAVPGLLMGEAMARGRGLLKGCGWAFFHISSLLAATLFFAHEALMRRALEPFVYYTSAAFQDEVRKAGLPAEHLEAWMEQFTALHQAMQVVWPAAYVILAAVLVMVNALLLRAYLLRRDPGWLDGGELESLRWPLALAVAFVACGATVVSPLLRPFGYNGLLVLAFFFALQGLAVVVYYARRLAAPPLLRGAVLLLVLANPWAPQILALLGLFDQWFNFRKWADVPPAAEV
ncbi:MAG TPA: DUF2232 domain-containing protein [Vicinamibacteria bacterium]